jgi:Flp pilus assembly protein TadD
MPKILRRLFPFAIVLAAAVIGAVLVRRAQSPIVTTPACTDPSTCATEARVSPDPTVTATAPSTAFASTRTPVPRSPAAAVDGATLRAEADRLIAEGRVVEGIDVFRRAVEAAPTAKNHGDLGSLLYRLTAFDEATLHLRAAAELDPGNADRWIALANVYYRRVNPGAAWEAEKRAREAEPGLELARDAEGMRVRK